MARWLGAVVLAVPPVAYAADLPASKRPLRVALVSGAETYDSDRAFAGLAEHLRREHGMECEVLKFSDDHKSLVGIERLLGADTAVFHVRRKTLNPEQLAVLKKFFASGKGFVALRSTSHGWENWKDFDSQVLGMKYGGPGGNNFGNAERLHLKPHPIWDGVTGLDTQKDLYRVTEPAADVSVILEGETKNGRVPVAWTRPHGNARLFYMALFHELEQPAFRLTIANALRWVTAPAQDVAVNTGTLRAAIEKSLPLLTAGARGSMEKRERCFTCHNQGLPIMALAAAQSRGFKIDAEELRKQVKFTADFLEKNRTNYLAGKGQGGQADTAGYALWALENGGWKSDATTAAVSEYLLHWQKDLDHWKPQSRRPPTEQSLFTSTHVALRGLKTFGTPEQRERIDRRFEQVRAWLLKIKAEDTEDRVFRLRALHLAGAPEAEVRKAAKELLDTQRADGGWEQLAGMETDSYATSTALVALHQAGGLATMDEAYRKGLRYLLGKQLADGSWFVTSRSKPIQAYFESGYPHGTNQFISISAASWATTALALALPKTARADAGQGSTAKPETAWVKSPKNPMLRLGPADAFDSQNIFAPAIAKDGGKFHLYYAGGPSGPKNGGELVCYQLGVALSDDGESWTKTGQPLLPLGTRDDFHATPALLRDPAGNLLKPGGLWHMVFCGNRDDDVEHATSRDGLTWEKDPRSPIFKKAYAPNLVQAGDELRMYYIHKPRLPDGKAGPWEVHLATGKDFHLLKPHPSNPMLTVSQPWEKGALFYPYVLRENETWVMLYGAYWENHPTSKSATAIGIATSRDGVHWTKSAANPALTPTPGSSYDSIYTSSQAVLRDGDGYKLYYGCRVDMVHKYFAIGLATKRGPLVAGE